MKYFLPLIVSFLFVSTSFSQDNEDLAKVYFSRAKKSYENKKYPETAEYLEKAKKYFGGITQQDVAVFGSEFFFKTGNYQRAEEYFKGFFKINKNKNAKIYKKMLLAYTDNLDAIDNPPALSKIESKEKETEKLDSIKKAVTLNKQKDEKERIEKSINAMQKSLGYMSDKSSRAYKEIEKSINKLKQELSALNIKSEQPDIEDNLNDDDINLEDNLEEINDPNSIEDISFAIIEDVPVFPGCTGNKMQLKNCFNAKIQKHFLRKFDSDLPNEIGLSSGYKKVIINFKIDKGGNVLDIQARAPHPSLREEVIKVMKTLPKMKPGKQKGEPVGVKYSIPFTLLVE